MTKIKKITIIVGYILAAATLIYFIYLTVAVLNDISTYEAESGEMISFKETLGYIMSNIHLPGFAFMIYVITKMYELFPGTEVRAYGGEKLPKATNPFPSAEVCDEKRSSGPIKHKHSVEAMTVSKISEKIGVSKDRIYRYCKTSGIRDKHKDESPLMLNGDEFKAIKAHFDLK